MQHGTPSRGQAVAFSVGLLILTLLARPAIAAGLVWDDGCGAAKIAWNDKCGLFQGTTNWTGNVLPQSGDSLTVPFGFGRTVAFANFDLGSLSIQNGSFGIAGEVTVTQPSFIDGMNLPGGGGASGDLIANGVVVFSGVNGNQGVFLKGSAGYVNNGTFTIGNPIQLGAGANFRNAGTASFNGGRAVTSYVNTGTTHLTGGTISQETPGRPSPHSVASSSSTSATSRVRPSARLFAISASRPITGTARSSIEVSRRSGHAASNATPVIRVRMSMRMGGRPIW